MRHSVRISEYLYDMWADHASSVAISPGKSSTGGGKLAISPGKAPISAADYAASSDTANKLGHHNESAAVVSRCS